MMRSGNDYRNSQGTVCKKEKNVHSILLLVDVSCPIQMSLAANSVSDVVFHSTNFIMHMCCPHV